MPRHETMEVDTSWLDPAESDPPPPAPARPSGPPRRETMEVQADWLEVDPVGQGPRRPSLTGTPRLSRASLPKIKLPATPPPFPFAGPSTSKRPRQPWEPPTLPPPPATAARARKVIPPPLPRGEEDEAPAAPLGTTPPSPARPSRKPPKA